MEKAKIRINFDPEIGETLVVFMLDSRHCLDRVPVKKREKERRAIAREFIQRGHRCNI